jgi:hypothetical protein
VGFEALDMALQARPPSPDVYWSASFDRPAAPVLQPSRLASPGASVRDGRRREIRVTLESIDSGTPEARAAEPDRTMGSSIDDATTLPSGQPVGLARPMPAPGFAVMSLGSQLDVRTQAAQGAWAPALRVSDGTVRMSQGLGRGSRKVAASTGRFFARLGRSVATASSQAVGSPSIDEGQ